MTPQDASENTDPSTSKKPGDDHALFEKIRAGDRVAFRKMFDRYYRRLLGTAINMLRNEEAAKDAVQEVFFQIWKKRETLGPDRSVEPYLKRAVINRCLNQIKSGKSFVGDDTLVDHDAGTPAADDILQAEGLDAALKAALNSLPERCRLIFTLKRLEGLSHKEIAAQLNISPKTIENQMTKALSILRKAVTKYRGPDP